MDAELMAFGLAILVLFLLALLIPSHRAMLEAQAEYAAALTNTRMQSYIEGHAEGTAKAERESRRSFDRGLRQGADEATKLFLQDSEWN